MSLAPIDDHDDHNDDHDDDYEEDDHNNHDDDDVHDDHCNDGIDNSCWQSVTLNCADQCVISGNDCFCFFLARS